MLNEIYISIKESLQELKVKTLLLTTVSLLISSYTEASFENSKLKVLNNRKVIFKKLPEPVSNIVDVFTEGMYYGRLRANAFVWNWDSDDYTDNEALGVGGSIIYKTAPIYNLALTVGAYTSQNPDMLRMEKEEVGSVKAGKDTFSRDQVENDGDFDGEWGLTTIGLLSLDYRRENFEVILGRQVYESFFTASNDTKMIPNTFDGVSLSINSISKTQLRVGYFFKQKLRDHKESHDIILFDSWKQNDDAGVNKSLVKGVVKEENKLLVTSIETKIIPGLKANLSMASVSDVFTSYAPEVYYTFNVGEWKVVPGLRALFQTDLLDSDSNVASLSSNTTGYNNPTQLGSSLWAARIDVKNNFILFRYGYSSVADDADIIAPFRGFPTGGFTRAMGQYNWRANTKSHMVQMNFDFDKANLLNGAFASLRYAIMDFDDDKPGVQSDANILHIDLAQEISDGMEIKLRSAFITSKSDIVAQDGTEKPDVSYDEYRLELNKLF